MKITLQPGILVISSPTGGGKSTLLLELMKDPEIKDSLEFPTSATTRKKRSHEHEGVDYYFVSKRKFFSMVKKGEFVEYGQVHKKDYYGTLKSEVLEGLKRGKLVILDIDVQGHDDLRKDPRFKDEIVGIFINVESLEILKERIRQRGCDMSEKILAERLETAEKEIRRRFEYDRTVVNRQGKLSEATAEVKQIVLEYFGEPEKKAYMY